MAKKLKMSPIHLQYWCKTSMIDEIVCQRRNVAYDKKLADSMEEKVRHYFIVDKKGNCGIVSGVEFEAYFNNKDVPLKDRIQAPEIGITEEAEKVRERWIKEVHGI